MDKKKIGIIGGGISGSALGYYLSLYKEAEITIFEKNALAAALPLNPPAPSVSLTTL